MSAVFRHVLPQFISVPSYLAFYTSFYLIRPCSNIHRSNFIWGFNIMNGLIAAPLLAGVLIDYVGVINTLPISDILFILGQLILYLRTPTPSDFEETVPMVGLFLTYFAYGLKETSRLVYTANTFIKRNNGIYNQTAFITQSSISVAMRYGILLFTYWLAIANNSQCDQAQYSQLQLIILITLILAGVGLFTSIMLYCMNKRTLKRQRISRPSIVPTEDTPNGFVFLGYNDRLSQTENEAPTMATVIATLTHNGKQRYLKYWLLGAACLSTMASANIQHPFTTSDLFQVSYGAQIVVALLLITATTEKRMRFLIFVLGIFMLIYQLFNFFPTGYLQWLMIPAFPMALLLTDVFTPIVLRYDLRAFGIIIGMKKWFENLLFIGVAAAPFFAGDANTDNLSDIPAEKYFQLGLVVVGFVAILLFDRLYLMWRTDEIRNSTLPLMTENKGVSSIMRN